MKARLLAALTCGAILLGVPAPALGGVIPNRCLGGIGLWDSRERVAREWGMPIRVSPSTPDVVWHYRDATVLLVRWNNEPTSGRWVVLGISTTDPRERVFGVGVGSWRSQVHAAVARHGGTCPRGARYCTLVYTERGGMRETVVRFDRNRVTELNLGTYSDYDDGPLQYVDKRCRDSR